MLKLAITTQPAARSLVFDLLMRSPMTAGLDGIHGQGPILLIGL
jgi:hypothetical protein